MSERTSDRATARNGWAFREPGGDGVWGRSPHTRPMTSFEAEVRRVVAMLGQGEVVSYGDVAAVAGRPGAPRAVGRIMSTSGDELPWWRVVYADGTLPPAKPPHQAALLRAEGVVVRAGRVVDAPAGRFAQR